MMDGVFVKRMNVGSYLLLLFSLVISSCEGGNSRLSESEGTTNVALDLTSVKDIFPTDSLKYTIDSLVLESCGDVVVGRVDNMLVLDSLIVINDRNLSKQIFVFNKDGSFSHYIGKNGRGPGEYLQVTDVAFQEGNIVVLDMFSHKILRYNLGGELIGEIKYKDKFHEIESDGKNLFAYAGDNRQNSDIRFYEFLVLGKDGMVNAAYHYNRNSINYKSEENIRQIGDGVYFTRALLPYICKYDENKGLQLRYSMDINPNPLPANFEKECKGDYTRFEAMYRQFSSYFSGNFWETDRYAGFSIESNKLPYLAIYDKEKNLVYAGIVGVVGKSHIGYADLLPFLLSRSVVVKSNTIYAVDDTDILNREANPVIVKISLQ